MTASFPLAQMGRLAQTLARLDQVPRMVSVYAAPMIEREIQKEFAQGRDPHGRKWKRLATGKPSHLTETGKLRSNTRVRPMPGNRAGLRIMFGSRAGIAGLHQTGTANMPARRILPDKGMPASWKTALERAHRRAMQEATR